MKTTPQHYTPSTLTNALSTCDIVQPKLAGLWCRVEVSRGAGRVYHPDGSELIYFDVPFDDVACTLIGDYFGPPRHTLSKIVVWDCWQIGTETDGRIVWTDLTTYGYRDRYALMKQQHSRIGVPLCLIKNYPIAQAQILWNDPNLEWCGVVFRGSRDPVGVEVKVARRYKEVPGELV